MKEVVGLAPAKRFSLLPFSAPSSSFEVSRMSSSASVELLEEALDESHSSSACARYEFQHF